MRPQPILQYSGNACHLGYRIRIQADHKVASSTRGISHDSEKPIKPTTAEHGKAQLLAHINTGSHMLWCADLDTALVATKSGTSPAPASDQLEGASADLLARSGHTNDHRLAPATVSSLQGSAHHLMQKYNAMIQLECHVYAAL